VIRSLVIRSLVIRSLVTADYVPFGELISPRPHLAASSAVNVDLDATGASKGT
jgi:hypothetical protein